LSILAADRGDFEEARKILTRAIEQGADDPWTEALLHAGRAWAAVSAGRDVEARDDFEAARAGFQAAEDEANVVSCAIQLAEFELFVGNVDAALAAVGPALTWARATGDRYRHGGALNVLGFAELERGRIAEALAAFAEGLELVIASDRTNSPIFCAFLTGIAFASGSRSARDGARLLGAAARIGREAGIVDAPREVELRQRLSHPLIEALGVDAWTLEQATGATQPPEETIALARRLADCDRR
jgi:tetratricopeptide (TPR) repeat protein